jgi:beta-mannosidase
MQTLDLARASWTFFEPESSRWLSASVPGCIHTDLRAHELIPDPFFGTNELDLQWIEERTWEYRASFEVPEGILGEQVIELAADGLDTVASVFLNGEQIGQTENMFIAHRWSVKPLLKAGQNELRITFRSALDYIRNTRTDFTPPREFNDPLGCCVRIRKQQCQFGWDWGPRFVTAGVWRGIRLEGWSGNRLVGAQLSQIHAKGGREVALLIKPKLERPDDTVTYAVSISLNGTECVNLANVSPSNIALNIPNPQLWWPTGQGEQPLYDMVLTATDSAGRVIGKLTRRIGLRTITLDRSPDAAGEKFQSVVNGTPIFIKGANWIPAHSFVAALTRADYSRDLAAAVQAHMNCVRVWGGGIYESEDFYDLCDELGLLVWQDFMFACNLYPADDAFVESVCTEAAHQITRIQHRACLALWCGNNELVQINAADINANPALKAGYERLFHEVLPAAVARYDAVTPYWPSSEWRGSFEGSGNANGEKSGDTHFWDVWHARHPVKDYEKWRFRFVSEFGMQSYSSAATNATFCPPGQDNVFGPIMENHQKNRAGNQIILDYVSRRYRFPKNQDALITLSQLNQAYCMKTGVEHYRRLMPHCMGSLYWQLNDCWPVASWSSLEFTGRWKALHYEARRFHAPALVSAHVPGDEFQIIGNYRRSSVREVHLYTVYDAPTSAQGTLRWDLFHLDGRVLLSGQKGVPLCYGQSVLQETLDLGEQLTAHGRDHLYLRIALDVNAETVSEDTVFLTPPRFIDLPRGPVTVTSEATSSPNEIKLSFTSPVFLHRFHFDLPGSDFSATDNFFDLHPNEPKTVTVTLNSPQQIEQALKQLQIGSLVDTYA